MKFRFVLLLGLLGTLTVACRVFAAGAAEADVRSIVNTGHTEEWVPTGIVLTRLFSRVDPRKAGSQNIGATNIYRTAGKTLGVLTLVGDMLKGAIPIWMAIMWCQHTYGASMSSGLPSWD